MVTATCRHCDWSISTPRRESAALALAQHVQVRHGARLPSPEEWAEREAQRKHAARLTDRFNTPEGR